MDITLNGEPFTVPERCTVRALVELCGLGAGPVAVEQNGVVVPRAEHPTTEIGPGDVLEIVHFVGGG